MFDLCFLFFLCLWNLFVKKIWNSPITSITILLITFKQMPHFWTNVQLISNSTINGIFVDWYLILKIKYMVIHWIHNDQLFSFVRHLKIYAIHVGVYWRRFRTPATFKTEHFVTKKISWCLSQKQFKNMLRKKWTLRPTNTHEQIQ